MYREDGSSGRQTLVRWYSKILSYTTQGLGFYSAYCGTIHTAYSVERDQRTFHRRLKPNGTWLSGLSGAYQVIAFSTLFFPAGALLRIKGACRCSSLRVSPATPQCSLHSTTLHTGECGKNALLLVTFDLHLASPPLTPRQQPKAS